MRERAGQLPLRQRVDAAITSTLLDTGYMQVGRTWMRTRGPDDNRLSTALTLQKSKEYPSCSFVVLYFFSGPNPPQTPDEWVARRHANIRYESMRHILAALDEAPQPDLPRALTTRGRPNEVLNDTTQIAQAAKMVFETVQSPGDLLTLADRLEEIEPGLSGILCFTASGYQALGIS